MELRTVGTIAVGTVAGGILPQFEKYAPGIGELLKIPTQEIYVIQDEKAGTIRIALSQKGGLPLALATFGGKDWRDHLDIDLLGDSNVAVEIILAALREGIYEATAVARTTAKIGVDQLTIYRMLDRIDHYVEIIRILSSR